ncbi:MAG: NAD-dependent epimerase/dehydratase family protein [Planctomycetota bacterium]
MTVLVTGATGFVGSAVARKLIERGERVRLLVRPQSPRKNVAGLDAELIEGDLRDRASLESAVKGCHCVFHVAADYRLWTRDPRELYASNVEGALHLMKAASAARVDRIVYTSSVATLGLEPGGDPGNEESPSSLETMIGHYKRSKFLGEEAVRRLILEDGLPAVIVNPSAPIGPRDVKPTPTGRTIVDAARGNMPAYVDTGLNVVHVDDVADGHLRALERGRVGERYILGGENLTLKQILEVVAEMSGSRAPSIRLPHGLILPIAHLAQGWARITNGPEPRVTVDGVKMSRKRMFFSSAKAERELDYRARPAREAIRDAIAWFREHGYLG